MSTTKTQPFDPAGYLDTSDGIAAYTTEALESGDPAFVADALGVLVRARGVTEVARDAGVSRESLCRAIIADGNPERGTIMGVAHAIVLQFSVTPLPQKSD